MKYYRVNLPLLLVLVFGACSQKQALQDSNTLPMDKGKLIEIVNSNLAILEEKLDTTFFLKRRRYFSDLKEKISPDKEYLRAYIDSFRHSLKELSGYYAERKQTEADLERLFVEWEQKSKNEIYNNVVLTEFDFANRLINSLLESASVLHGFGSSIIPNKDNVKPGEEFKAKIRLNCFAPQGKKWLAYASVYYENDTVPIKSDTFNFGQYENEFSFKPSRKGNYLLKGSSVIFNHNNYLSLPFELEFKVE